MYLPDYPSLTSHAPPDLAAVQNVFSRGRISNHHVTTMVDEEQIRAIKVAIRASQRTAIEAIRAARLIDLGEIDFTCFEPNAYEEVAAPFGGEPTAYTFVTRASETNRLRRLLCVIAPRQCICCIFEIALVQGRLGALWLSTAIQDEFFGASPETVDLGWAAYLPSIVAQLKIERVPAPVDENRKRRARGLSSLPGHFKASLPPPSASTFKASSDRHHASPEPHLRRGHTRRLRDGRTISVRSCCIRGGPTGVGSYLHSTSKGAL